MPPVASSQHSVYCALPGLDPAEVVGERAVDVRRRARARDHGLAEVADVEDADRLADGRVLLDHAGGVLQRHRPAAELGELRAERHVAVVQRRGAGRPESLLMARNLPQRGRSARGLAILRSVTTYTLRNASPAKTRADAVVVGVVQHDKGPRVAPGGEDVATAYGRKLQPLLATLGVTGKAGEVAKVPTGGTINSPLLVLVGLGEEADADAGTPGRRRRRPGGHATPPRSRSPCPPTRPSWSGR